MPPSKPSILSRYERAPDGEVLIDVAAARVEDLYEDFDKTAPFIRRDLDQDLVDYLTDCAAEIGKTPFRIRFSLANPPLDGGLSRIQQSVNGYFLYVEEIERRKVRQIVRQSWLLFGIGLTLLFVSVSAHQWLVKEHSVVNYVFAEGLTIAAWVSMWNAVAIYLIDWFPHQKQIRLYRRLAGAELLFRTVPQAEVPSAAEVSQPPVATNRIEAVDSGPHTYRD